MPFERIEIFSINFNLRENEGEASKPFRLTRKGGKKEKKEARFHWTKYNCTKIEDHFHQFKLLVLGSSCPCLNPTC